MDLLTDTIHRRSATPTTAAAAARRSYARIPTVLEPPHFVQHLLDSYQWFLRDGLRELLDELSPIQDYNQKSMDLSFPRYEFQEPRHAVDICRERDQTFAAKWTLDLAATYAVNGWEFTVGGDNVLNEYPDEAIYANSESGQLPYSSYAPFGFNGAFAYAKVGYKW